MNKESENRRNRLRDAIGYDFKDEALLARSMVHSSYVNEHGQTRAECNERLEFLGDAVLELVSSDHLYRRYPSMSEGELTKLRASLVCEPALAFDARRLGLDAFLILGKGEELTGGRKRDSILSDALEALIGAIYLDGGMERAEEFIIKHVLDDIEDKKLFNDSKSALQEIAQRDFLGVPEYRITGETGPDHAKTFTAQVYLKGELMGQGQGSSKKNAEQQASYNALLKLKGGR